MALRLVPLSTEELSRTQLRSGHEKRVHARLRLRIKISANLILESSKVRLSPKFGPSRCPATRRQGGQVTDPAREGLQLLVDIVGLFHAAEVHQRRLVPQKPLCTNPRRGWRQQFRTSK